MKKTGYIILGILLLGGFGTLGYLVGEGVKAEMRVESEKPHLQNPRAELVTGSNGIKISG
ncbi:MAG: hypothetical protein AB1608_05795 [Thermoproteota archaeon]